MSVGTYYIGETGTTFTQRLQQHLAAYLFGVYQFYDPSRFAVGTKKLVWEGTWRAGTERGFVQFARDLPRLAPVLHSFLSTHRLLLVPMNGEERLRRRIEGALAKALGHGTDSSLQDPEIRYQFRTPEESPITVSAHAATLVGLPPQFEA